MPWTFFITQWCHLNSLLAHVLPEFQLALLHLAPQFGFGERNAIHLFGIAGLLGACDRVVTTIGGGRGGECGLVRLRAAFVGDATQLVLPRGEAWRVGMGDRGTEGVVGVADRVGGSRVGWLRGSGINGWVE
jgi:hypothetical protein